MSHKLRIRSVQQQQIQNTGARRRQHVRTLGQYTVYVGELIGIILALDLALDYTRSYPDMPMRIFTDNQVTIKAVRNPRNRSGQFALKVIFDKVHQLDKPVSLHWIPAHVGVPGKPGQFLAEEPADAGDSTAPKPKVRSQR